MYPETIGRKSSDEVCPLIHNLVYNYSFSVHSPSYPCTTKACSVKVTFPIRGHSSIECDKVLLIKNLTSNFHMNGLRYSNQLEQS